MGPCQMCKSKDKCQEIAKCRIKLRLAIKRNLARLTYTFYNYFLNILVIPDDISTIRKSGKDTHSRASKLQNGSFFQNMSEIQFDSQDQKRRDANTAGTTTEKQAMQAGNNHNNNNEDTQRRATNTYFCSIENDVESAKNKLFNNAIIDINENRSEMEILLELEKQSYEINHKKDQNKQEIINTQDKILELITESNQTQKEQITKSHEKDDEEEDNQQEETNNSLNNILKDLNG